MDVSLKPELERFAEDQVKARRFSSVPEVLEMALNHLMLYPPLDESGDEAVAAIEESEQQILRREGLDRKPISARLLQTCLGEEGHA